MQVHGIRWIQFIALVLSRNYSRFLLNFRKAYSSSITFFMAVLQNDSKRRSIRSPPHPNVVKTFTFASDVGTFDFRLICRLRKANESVGRAARDDYHKRCLYQGHPDSYGCIDWNDHIVSLSSLGIVYWPCPRRYYRNLPGLICWKELLYNQRVEPLWNHFQRRLLYFYE